MTTTARTDYADIYDHVTASHDIYNRAQNSPGYQACLLHAERLKMVDGPVLDVGCGVGFVVELLGRELFNLEAWGVDVSPVAVERARERFGADRFRVADGSTLPFDDDAFGLVTCFDVLEHLDEHDIPPFFAELTRVLRPGGLLFCSASTRPAGSTDKFGDNLHRTVRQPQWWIDLIEPDEALVRTGPADVLLWKRKPRA